MLTTRGQRGRSQTKRAEMALNAWGDAVAKRLQEILQTDERPSKKGAAKSSGESSAAAASADRQRDRAEVPAPAHRAWIEGTLERSLRAFAQAAGGHDHGADHGGRDDQDSGGRVAAPSPETRDRSGRNLAAGRRGQHHRHGGSRKSREDARLDAVEARGRRQGCASSHQHCEPQADGSHRELRWDTPYELLMERAQTIVKLAKIPAEHNDHVGPIAGRAGTGSAASLWFHEERLLEKAKAAARALGHEFEGAHGKVWLDVKKSHAELRPARMIHRALDAAQDVERSKGRDPANVTKQPASKTLKMNG